MEEAREHSGAGAEAGGPAGGASAERAGAQLELLGFMLGEEEYAVDVLEVKEIVRLQPITAVPRSPACIRGIVTLRGVIVPVYDLHSRLGLRPAEQGPDARIAVVYRGEELAGLLVDRITQVVRLAADRVEPPPHTIALAEAECLRGVARIDDRLMILLDLARVLEVSP